MYWQMRDRTTRNTICLIVVCIVIVSPSSTTAFVGQHQRGTNRGNGIEYTTKSWSARPVSATLPDDGSGNNERTSSSNNNMNVDENSSYFNFEEADKADADVENIVSEKQKILRERYTDRGAGTYKIQLSLSKNNDSNNNYGMTVAEVLPGRRVISDRVLDLDSMEIVPSIRSESTIELNTAVESSFRGLVVTSVLEGSAAAKNGVQVGDLLLAVSATLGDAIWPTSTLQGVRSALSSRKYTSGSVTLQLKRPELIAVDEEDRTNQATGDETLKTLSQDTEYELTLTRPLGFQIGEDKNGYVVVTSISDTASNLVQYAVAVGDRVVAVDSSLGGKLWPVSTVEGVISAVTGRLPGKSVTIRFERPKGGVVQAQNQLLQSTTEADKAVVVETPATPTQKELIKRCREVLKRYAGEGKLNASMKLSTMVADKVVDALASASATIDSVTLSMIMNFYLSCNQAKSAIRIFEAATGFRADGSSNPAQEIIKGQNGNGQIQRSESALNLFTGTALLKAHAVNGDFSSVLRVLAALEGRSGVADEDGLLESAPWPWTGTYGSIQPDTVCYNVAIAAAEKVGGSDALLRALELFDRMQDPNNTTEDDVRPKRNEVSYNTLISALSNAGLTEQAFALFQQMKNAKLRPDKYTYTSLLKVCTEDGDIEEILYEMRERGVTSDVVTYNTMIKYLCDKRKLTQATKIVTDMEARGIAPDSRTYGLLMNGMIKANKPSSCLTLFESACSNVRSSALTENVYLYTTAITAATIIGDHERALELIARMTARGVKPNMKTLTAVVGACLADDRPDLAAQLYRKIDSPDGYAMRQGIRAFCFNGELEAAAELIESQQRRDRKLTGKQVMLSYKNILHASLKEKDFYLARRMFADMISKGYIPNKAIIFSMIDAMQLNRRPDAEFEQTEDDGKRFHFLLFVADQLRNRNLAMESALYIATLTLGAQTGGNARKIASLFVLSKKATDEGMGREILASAKSVETKTPITLSWETLLDEYDNLSEVELSALPSLQVRTSTKDLGRILRAERAVSSSKRRKIKNEAVET